MEQNQDNLVMLIKQLAREEREESKPCSFLIGEVVSVSPVKIRLTQKLTIDKDFFYLCENVKSLEKGDKVAVFRAQGGQKFLILDKVV